MANTIKLPARKGTIEFSEEDLQDIAQTLEDLPVGEAVVVDVQQDTETKARDRAKKVKALLDTDTYDYLKVKAHAVEDEDGNFIPAVSLPIGTR